MWLVLWRVFQRKVFGFHGFLVGPRKRNPPVYIAMQRT